MLRVLVVLALLLTAGCLGGPQGTGSDGAADHVSGLPSGTPTDGEVAARGLDTPPTLRLGEWWTFAVAPAFEDEDLLITVVAAGLDADGRLLLGTPDSLDRVDAALIYHMPPLGELDRGTFGWDIHDEAFAPIQFPAQVGTTWTTTFYERTFDAEVIAVRGNVAEVEMLVVGDPGPDVLFGTDALRLTYDATAGLVTSLQWGDLYALDLVDHGFGYEGTVLVPTRQDLIFLHGPFGPATDSSGQPYPSSERVTIQGAYTDMSIAFLLGSPPPMAAIGNYKVTATDPAGTVFEETYLATPQEGYQVRLTHRTGSPAGAWDLEYEAGGPGYAAFEAVAYTARVVDVDSDS